MIRTKKLTPLAYGYLAGSRRPPQPEMTLIMRAKLSLEPGRRPELVQTPVTDLDTADLSPQGVADLDEAAYVLGQGHLTADVYAEEDEERSGQLLYPSDFATFKPHADVMAKGTCHPPGGQASECPVAFSVGDFRKELLVVGPRVWVDKFLGGKHTDPLPFESMPVDWAHAYGGADLEQNPVGKGHEAQELPNVEDPRHPIRTARAHPQPAGFGPINPSWPLRRDKVGKEYGSDWEQHREPYQASDYDWSHQNAAPADQQLDGFLRGDETIRFWNLHPDAGFLETRLPGLRPRSFMMNRDGEMVEIRLVLDTLFAHLDERQLYLTWRGQTEVAEDDLSDVAFLLLVHEQLADEPRPAAEYFEALEAYSHDPTGLADSPASALIALEKDIDDGTIDARIDALGDDEEPIRAIFGPIVDDGSEQTRSLFDQLARGMDQAEREQPGVKAQLREELKRSLHDATDGVGGPRPAMTADGGLALGPFVRGVLRMAVAGQQEVEQAGFDLSDQKEQLEQALRAADIPGVSADDLSVARAAEPPPEPAPGADFSGHDLTGRDFAGLDLHGASFDGAVLTDANLAGCNLAGASLRGATLARTNLSDADCQDADLSGAYLSKTRAAGVRLARAKLDQAYFVKVELAGADLRGVSTTMVHCHKSDLSRIEASQSTFDKCAFDNVDLSGATFRQAKLPRTLFRQCNLTLATFDGAELSAAGFLESDLTEASFFQCQGDTTNWMKATLREVDFRYARLPHNQFMEIMAPGAQFACADLPAARFYRAVLREADFEQANLFGADLRKTSLMDASFRHANLYLAKLIEAFGTDADFRKANLGMANLRRNKLVMKT